MSTFTDGAPPSVSPEPDEPSGRTGETVNGSDTSAGWLQAEIQRRIAARSSEGGGARHARRGVPSNAAVGHAPRHSVGPAPSVDPGRPARPVPGRPPAVQEPPALPARIPAAEAAAAQAPPLAPPAWEQPVANATTDLPVVDGRAAATGPYPTVAPRPAPAPRPRPVPADTAPAARPPAGGPAAVPVDVPGEVHAAAFADVPVAGRVEVPAEAPVESPDVESPTDARPAVPVERGGPRRGGPTPSDGSDGRLSGVDPAAAPRRVASPSWPATPVGPGLSEFLPPTVARAGSAPRPAPPSGPAIARLLSPPTSPPSTPTGLPLDAAPAAASDGHGGPAVADPLPRIGPRPTASPELEASGEVIWTSLTPPDTQPADAARLVEVPVQRSSATAAPAETEPEDDLDDGAGVGERADLDRPAGALVVDPDAEPEEEPIKRVRVVLAERKAVARPVRTVVDVEEGTGVGEVLRRDLIRRQFRVALAFAAAAVLALALLPLVFRYLPQLGHYSVLGIRLPWILLGGLVYPLLLGLGWWHTRTAEGVEKSFADHVQD